MSKSKLTEKKLTRFLIYAVVGILVSWIWTYFSLKYFGDTNDSRSTFGDMFGGVNALFSGFALVGIIYTILLQKVELGYQRDELKLTRNELKLTRKEIGSQSEIMRLQKFENTFFNLINNHQNIKKSFFYEEHSGDGGIQLLEKELTEKLNGVSSIISYAHIPSNYTDFLPEEFEKMMEDSLIFVEDCILIINFIEESSSNEKLYHRILKNAFSKSERMIFGWYLRNYDTQMSHSLIDFYSETYNDGFSYINNETEYPPDIYVRFLKQITAKRVLPIFLENNSSYIRNHSKEIINFKSLSIHKDGQMLAEKEYDEKIQKNQQFSFFVFPDYFHSIPTAEREGNYQIFIGIHQKHDYFIEYTLNLTSIDPTNIHDLEVTFNLQ